MAIGSKSYKRVMQSDPSLRELHYARCHQSQLKGKLKWILNSRGFNKSIKYVYGF